MISSKYFICIFSMTLAFDARKSNINVFDICNNFIITISKVLTENSGTEVWLHFTKELLNGVVNWRILGIYPHMDIELKNI